MTKVIKMLGSAGFAAILAFMIAAFAAIGPPGHNAKAASFSDQGMYATSSSYAPSIDVVVNDRSSQVASLEESTIGTWTTTSNIPNIGALTALSRVTRYAPVGFGFLANNTNNSQVSSGNGSVFESPASSTLSSHSQSGLALGADSALSLTSGYGTTVSSAASIQAISGQSSFMQNAYLTLCVVLSILIAVLVLASYTLRPGYAFGTESSTPFGNGWISKRFGAPMRRNNKSE